MGDPPFPCDDAGELSGWTAPIGDFDAITIDDIKAAYSFAREFLEALISFRGFLHNWR